MRTGPAAAAGSEPEKRAVDRGCALVTGASRGIGAAIARGLAADGWAVGVNYRQREDDAEAVVSEIGANGGKAVAIQADVSLPESPKEIILRLESEFDRPVLVLVNNAGLGVTRLSLHLSEADWQRVLETNLSAAYRLTRLALRSMSRQRYGRIVNVSSAAVERPAPGQSAYVAAKAGLVGFTKAVAVEVAERSVTVNAIAPGLIETDLGAQAAELPRAGIPAGRMGTPDEVAACVRFLASEDAAYVTGTVLTVDGGLSA